MRCPFCQISLVHSFGCLCSFGGFLLYFSNEIFVKEKQIFDSVDSSRETHAGVWS